jgi:hypothetical protein
VLFVKEHCALHHAVEVLDPLIVNRDDIPKRTRCSLVMAPFAGDGIILAPAIRRGSEPRFRQPVQHREEHRPFPGRFLATSSGASSRAFSAGSILDQRESVLQVCKSAGTSAPPKRWRPHSAIGCSGVFCKSCE